jgi:hypothetical protein
MTMDVDRMEHAKASFTAAALAVLRGDPDAELLCELALAELQAALTEQIPIPGGAGDD